MSDPWFRVDTIDEEIVITCLKCTGATKVRVPCEIPDWDRAVRAFRKDHKLCEPPKNKPIRVPPKTTRYKRILSDD